MNPRSVKLRSLARFHLDVCMVILIQKMSWQNAAFGRAGCTILAAGGWLAASTAGKQTLDLFQALPCGSPAARIRAKRKCLKLKFLDLLSAGSHDNDTQHLPDICSLDHLLLRRQQTLPFSSVLLQDTHKFYGTSPRIVWGLQLPITNSDAEHEVFVSPYAMYRAKSLTAPSPCVSHLVPSSRMFGLWIFAWCVLRESTHCSPSGKCKFHQIKWFSHSTHRRGLKEQNKSLINSIKKINRNSSRLNVRMQPKLLKCPEPRQRPASSQVHSGQGKGEMCSDASVSLKNICGALTNKMNVLIQMHHQLFNLFPLNVWTSTAWKTEIFCPTSVSDLLIYLYPVLTPSQRKIPVLTIHICTPQRLFKHVFLAMRCFSMSPGWFVLFVGLFILFGEVLNCGLCWISKTCLGKQNFH